MINSQEFSCRLCEATLFPKEWQGAECGTCGSVSVTTLPSNSEIAEYYRAYNETYSGGGQSEGRNQIRYAHRYLEIMSPYVDAGKLIDVGCSTNPFPNIAADKKFDVTVLDYAKPVDLSRQVTFIQGSIDDESVLSGYENSFDVVTAWAVMEHLPRPQKSAKILASICRKGGMLFLSTPEIGTFLTDSSIGRSNWFYPPEHLNLVSPEGLRIIFEKQGCVMEKWGRLELTPVRFIARYGIGCVEAVAGMAVKNLLPGKWQNMRDSRVHAFKGITYFVLRKI